MTGQELRGWTRSFGNLAGGEAITSVLRLLALLVVARRLGPTAFGTVSVGFVVGGYLVILAHPGLEVAGTRAIAADASTARRLLARVVGLRLVLGAVAYPLTVLITILLPLDRDGSVIVVLFGLLIFTQALDVRWAFVGIQRTFPVAVASVSGAACYLVAVTSSVRGPDDLVLVAVFHVAAQALISVFLLAASRRRFGPWRPHVRSGSARRSLLAESTPLTIASVARAATVSLDVILVKIYRPAPEAGHYAAASRLMTVGLVYLSLYYGTLLPSLVRAARHGEESFRAVQRTTARRSVILGATVAAMGVLLTPTVVPLVFGDEYEATVGLLQVLIGALFVVSLSGLVNNSLIAIGRERTFSSIMILGLAVNLLANVLLLPAVGTVGAAIATVVTEVVVLVAAALALRAATVSGRPRLAEVAL